MSFIIRLLVNAAALWVATQLVSGVVFTGNWLTLLAVALVFGVVNAIVRPVTKLVTFPFIILTLGLFLFVINGLMLMLTSAVSGWLGLGFDVRGFGAAFWGALVVSVVNWVVWLFIHDRDKRPT
jgi:putative membrane protein